jgi:Cu2+-containing amine oxidase
MRADNKKVIRTDKQILKAIKKGQVLPQNTTPPPSNVTNPVSTTSANTSQNVSNPQVSTSQVSTPQNPLLESEAVEVVNVNPTTQTTQVQKLPTIPAPPPQTLPREEILPRTLSSEELDALRAKQIAQRKENEREAFEEVIQATTLTPELAEALKKENPVLYLENEAKIQQAVQQHQKLNNQSQGKGFGQFVQENKVALGIGLALVLGSIFFVSMKKDSNGKGTNGLGNTGKPTFKKLKLM